MLSQKTLRSLLVFTENQRPGPSFIIIYIFTWLAWHNQIISAYIQASGDFWARGSAAISAIEENQYMLVFFITCLILLFRLAFAFLSFKSREALNSADDDYSNAREDQKFEQNKDIQNLLATLETTKKQLQASKEREKKSIEEKNEAIRKALELQQKVEELQADLALSEQVK